VVYAWKVLQSRTLPHLITSKVANAFARLYAQIIHQHTP